MALVVLDTVVIPPATPRAVLRRSHDRRFELAHTVDGIEPFNPGFDVSDSVCSESGSELGGEAKLLLVKYLITSV